ncbi:Xylulose kinase [subsurface metagenome]
MMKQILTADIGTTGTKTALFDESGRTIARAYTEYPLIPESDYAERDPEDWWHALREGFRQLRSYIIEENLQAVVLGGQMQDLIFIKNNKALYPAILYYDTRAGLEMEEIQSTLGNKRIKEITEIKSERSAPPLVEASTKAVPIMIPSAPMLRSFKASSPERMPNPTATGKFRPAAIVFIFITRVLMDSLITILSPVVPGYA